MKRAPIDCPRHGAKQRRAFVCIHALSTLHDRAPRGFQWGRDSEGEYAAWCDACSLQSIEERNRLAPALVRPLCLHCFADIGRINGIKWPDDP
ncbi:MAG: hypothetical protein AB7J28_14220 [Hyphomonadaceae bacterium]